MVFRFAERIIAYHYRRINVLLRKLLGLLPHNTFLERAFFVPY